MKKNIFKIWLMALPMLLGLASCAEHDNPASNPNPLAKQVSGLWWTLIDTEGTLPEEFEAMDYTRMGMAYQLNEDGTGYGVTFFFNNEQSNPIQIIGGEYWAPMTYTTTADGRIIPDFGEAYKAYGDYYKQFTATYSDGVVTVTNGERTLTLEHPSDAMAETIRDWDYQFNGGATADNYNINDEDFTPDNWREQEAIYIYDGTGTDVTDAKGRTGYTLVNMPWYEGDVLTNLPEGFCNDITPGNGWEWVLNRCGSRTIMNCNFFAVYNKYCGILRFFYYLPYGFNTGNDHVWQVSMTDHLAQQSVWRYGLPSDKTLVDKATIGQTGDGTFMTYVTPWTNYMSNDGLITPNAGWWAFDIDLSQTRLDDVQSGDNIRLQMRSWNTQHVSLSSTMRAAIEGNYAGNLDASVNLLQSQHLNNSAMGIVAKIGSMAGNLGSAIYNLVSPDGEKGKALGGIVEFAKGGCNLAGIKTETAHDIEGSIKGKMEGTITLGLTGTIDTEGTIRGSAPTVGIASPTFYLKDFDLKNSHLGQGVWNLKTPPVVYVLNPPYNSWFGRVCPYFFDPNSIEIQLNPDVFPESQVEWIKVEALCTAKTSKFNDDETRLAYGLGSYDAKGIYQSELWKISINVDYDWFSNLQFGNNVFKDFLYSSEDKMGFDLKQYHFGLAGNSWLDGRCKDDLWLEPGVWFLFTEERLPFLEVNVTVRVKMKGMDTPILLSRNYLPEYKKYDAGEMYQSVQKASAYKHTELYNYQMKRISDIIERFSLPGGKWDSYNYIPMASSDPNEKDNYGYDKLFDGTSTDWYTSIKKDGVWFAEFKSRQPITPSKYYLTTCINTSSYPHYNPKNWKVMAKANQGDSWTTIATVTNDLSLIHI